MESASITYLCNLKYVLLIYVMMIHKIKLLKG